MDDYVASFDTIDEAASVQHQLQNALSEGNFKLVKWCSNSRSLCENMDPALLSKPVEKLFAADNLERVLGIQWNVSKDTICFTPPEKALKLPCKLTQRSLLSLISQLYDPLGLIAPFLIRIKILLQKTWQTGQNWDQLITDTSFYCEIKRWIQQLETLQKVSIPRQHPFSPSDRVELHIFCDASMSAMAVVAFYVFLSDYHSSRSSFIIGKARVSPLKQQTIPRLELQAAVYAIRMRRTICNETTFNIVDVHHWSDSSSVLHWISNTHERHKIFVANRLSEFLDHSQRSEWRYVPSKLNPADNATRGLPASET